MPIALLTLFSLAVFVVADVSSSTYVNNQLMADGKIIGGDTSQFLPYDELPMKDVEGGGKTSYVPFIQSYFKIYKGWNLIPASGELARFPGMTKSRYEGYPIEVAGCGTKENDRSGNQIKYRFAYVPGKGYVGGKLGLINAGQFEDSSVQSDFENSLRDYYLSSEMGGEDGIWTLYTTSEWIYSDMDCNYVLSPHLALRDIPRSYQQGLSKAKLSQGWNLIFISPSFLDKKFGDSLGECEVVRVNQWNPKLQKWEYSSSESEQEVSNLLNTEITKDNLFSPLVIKVAEDCNLGNSVTAPPIIPN